MNLKAHHSYFVFNKKYFFVSWGGGTHKNEKTKQCKKAKLNISTGIGQQPDFYIPEFHNLRIPG